ncbi:11209_t:CDS:1, partial [Diversispora eburnea]
SIETITEVTTTETDLRRDSQFSTLSIVEKMGKQLTIQSQEIIDEKMSDADNSKGIGGDIAEGA